MCENVENREQLLINLIVSAKTTLTEIDLHNIVELRDKLTEFALNGADILWQSTNTRDRFKTKKLIQSAVHDAQMMISSYHELIRTLDELNSNALTPLF